MTRLGAEPQEQAQQQQQQDEEQQQQQQQQSLADFPDTLSQNASKRVAPKPKPVRLASAFFKKGKLNGAQEQQQPDEKKKKSEIRRKRRKVARHLRALLILTPFFASAAMLCYAVSLATTDWLRTEEKMPNKNRTVLFGPNKSPEYLPKLTRSGLFELCYTRPGKLLFKCYEIDYFPKELYQPDQNDSTMSIPYAVINSAWFFFVAGGLMSVATTLCSFGYCTKKKKITTFVAGVSFILSGLFLFIGQIVYISILKGEVSAKLVPVSLLSPPRLSYQYGWSFLLLISSFLCCEVTGTLAIFLYMYHHQYRWLSKQDESSLANRLFKNQLALLNQSGHTDLARQAMEKQQELQKRQQEQQSKLQEQQVQLQEKQHRLEEQRKLGATFPTLESPGSEERRRKSLIGNGAPSVHTSLLKTGQIAMCVCQRSAIQQQQQHQHHHPASLPVTPRPPCRCSIICSVNGHSDQDLGATQNGSVPKSNMPFSRSRSLMCGQGPFRGSAEPLDSTSDKSLPLLQSPTLYLHHQFCDHQQPPTYVDSTAGSLYSPPPPPPPPPPGANAQSVGGATNGTPGPSFLSPLAEDSTSSACYSTSEEGAGGFLLQSYPQRFYPHYHSGPESYEAPAADLLPHYHNGADDDPKAKHECCKCIHCGFTFHSQALAANAPASAPASRGSGAPGSNFLPLIVHADNLFPTAVQQQQQQQQHGPRHPAGGGVQATAGGAGAGTPSAADCICRRLSDDIRMSSSMSQLDDEDDDKDTRV